MQSPEFLDYFLILGRSFIGDPMALVDHEKREVLEEFVGSTGNRLNASEDGLLVPVFFSEARGKDSGLKFIARVLGVVLFHEFFDVSENKDAAFGNLCELRNDETFSCSRRKDNQGRFTTLFKVFNGARDGFLLVGT